MSSTKSVLITGTSRGGIGSAIAFEYQKRGYTVFATARTVSKIDPDLVKLPRVETVQLDVTSQESIKAAVKHVESRTNGKLDVLINNSGGGYTMPLTDVDIPTARALYEVNVWGLLATTQEFIPLLKHAKGTVVNVGSVAGQFGLPLQAIYNSSKSAVNMLSEMLRLELKPFGVRVVTVMAGGVKTEFFNNVETSPLPDDSIYQPISKEFASLAAGEFGQSFQNSKTFASNLVKDIEGGASGKVWRGNSSTQVRWLTLLLPTFVSDIIGSRMAGLHKI